MPRLVLLALIAVLALPAAASARPRVALTDCVTSVSQAERTAGFEGRMKTRRPGQLLQMRFRLQSRALGGGRWRRVEVPGWNQWLTADPGITYYAYEKRVESLAAPAVYRAVVRFRWSTALGKVTRVARAVSESCAQPDLRPDLRALAVERADGHYLVTVGNSGRSSAGAFLVTLAVNGAQREPQEVGALGPRSKTTVALSGPRCEPGSEIVVTVDSELAVDERDELDNVLAVPCPGG